MVKRFKVIPSDQAQHRNLGYLKCTLTSEYLVEEDFDVVSGEVLRRDDDLVKVALEQLRDHITECFGQGGIDKRQCW